MTDKQSEEQPKRNPADHLKKHQFKPGQSGNPEGRSKKEKTFSDTARQLLEAKSVDITFKSNKGKEKRIHLESSQNFYHSLVVALLMKALKGDVRAIRELANRTDGLPKQSADIKFDGFILKVVGVEIDKFPQKDADRD